MFRLVSRALFFFVVSYRVSWLVRLIVLRRLEGKSESRLFSSSVDSSVSSLTGISFISLGSSVLIY